MHHQPLSKQQQQHLNLPSTPPCNVPTPPASSSVHHKPSAASSPRAASYSAQRYRPGQSPTSRPTNIESGRSPRTSSSTSAGSAIPSEPPFVAYSHQRHPQPQPSSSSSSASSRSSWTSSASYKTFKTGSPSRRQSQRSQIEVNGLAPAAPTETPNVPRGGSHTFSADSVKGPDHQVGTLSTPREPGTFNEGALVSAENAGAVDPSPPSNDSMPTVKARNRTGEMNIEGSRQKTSDDSRWPGSAKAAGHVKDAPNSSYSPDPSAEDHERRPGYARRAERNTPSPPRSGQDHRPLHHHPGPHPRPPRPSAYQPQHQYQHYQQHQHQQHQHQQVPHFYPQQGVPGQNIPPIAYPSSQSLPHPFQPALQVINAHPLQYPQRPRTSFQNYPLHPTFQHAEPSSLTVGSYPEEFQMSSGVPPGATITPLAMSAVLLQQSQMNHPPGRVNSVQPSVQQYGPYHHHPTPSMWQAQYYTGQYDYDYYSQPPMMYQAAPSYTYMSPQPPPAQNRGLNTNAPTFTPRPALPSKKVAIINPATNREVNPIVPTGSLIEANGSNIVKSPSVIDMRKPDTSKEKDVIKTAVQSKQKGDPKVGDITEHSDGENKEDVAQNEAVARVLEDETKQQQLVMEEADQRAKEESDRLECEEKDLREQEEAEQKRLEQEQKESQEREEMEHREKEERERFEKERLEKERLEMERLENERLEKERLEISLLEKERFEKEQLEKERVLKEQLEKEQLEKEQLEKEQLEKEQLEKEQLEKEQLEKDQLEKEQLEKDQLEKDQLEKGKFEKEKIEREEQEHHETTEKQRVELAERNFLVVNETETLVKETEQQQSIDGTQIQFVRQDRHGSIGVDSDAQGTITEDKARRESVSGTREWPAVNNRQDSSQSSSGDQGSALFTDGRRSSSPPISRDPSRIDNFNNVTYPTMTRSPPIRDTDGRIRYSRDFLMQFKDICKSKPASYRVLQAYGVINPEPERRVSISSEPMYGQRSGAPQGGRSGSISERVIEPYKLDTALARSGRSISHDQRFPPAKLGRSPSYQALTPRGDPLSRTPSYRTSKGPRGGGQVRGNDRGRQELVSPILSEYAPLVKTENAWAPKLSAGKSLSDSFASEPVTQEMITRKVKALLNKLTKDNIESISGQVIEIANFSVKESDGTTLKHCIHLIFEKATDEPGFGSVYASLCAKMLQEISSDVKDEALPGSTGGKLFRKYLLSICQEEFERGWKDKASLDGVSLNDKDGPDLMSDEYYVMMKAKRQGLGLIRFIGELYKQKMLTEKIMHECVKKLLANVTNPEEEETEGLCKLMTTIGALLDRPEAKGHMDVYFVRMQELTKSSKLSSRVRFLVQDVIDMRANNWVSRREVSGPKTIAEIHEQAAREHQEQEMMRRTTSSSGRGLPTRREQMSRGPSFRNDYPFPQSPNKKMDLSNFGNTTRSKANDMTFEPASAVFGAFSKSKRPAPSSAKRPSQVGLSNVNTFAALQDFDDHKAETTKPTLTERPKLNIAPRTIPSPESEPVAKSLIDPKPEPKKTEEQAVRSISNTLKEYLSLRDMEELLVSIDELDRCYIPLLVTEFVNQSIVMKRENVDQVAEAFKSLRNQNRITSADFEKGFEVPLKDLGDTAIDVPNAYTYAGMLLEAAGLDPSKAVKP